METQPVWTCQSSCLDLGWGFRGVYDTGALVTFPLSGVIWWHQIHTVTKLWHLHQAKQLKLHKMWFNWTSNDIEYVRYNLHKLIRNHPFLCNSTKSNQDSSEKTKIKYVYLLLHCICSEPQSAAYTSIHFLLFVCDDYTLAGTASLICCTSFLSHSQQ